MGRAKGGNVVAATSVSRRVGARATAQPCVMTVLSLIDADSEFARVGEQLDVAGELYTVQEGDAAAGIHGLANVDSVQRLPNGLYRVTTNDGATALVNLDEMQVAHSSGDDVTPADTLGALYAAMGHKAMYETDPATTNPYDPMAALGDAFAATNETDEDASAEMLADVARAAQAQLAAQGGDVTVNPDGLTRMLSPESPERTSDRAAQRAAMTAWRENVQRVMADAESTGDDSQLSAARALLFHADPATGQLLGVPNETMEAEYLQAAEDLGCPIPELKIAYDENGLTIGDFEVGAPEKERIDIVRNALSYGDRSFTFRGPPGSGKGEMAGQIAAILRCPYVPINVGPSSDLEQNIGGDGLRAQVVETEEPLFGNDGQPILVKGKPMTTTRKSVVTVSQTIYGPLAEAAKRPCIIEIMEPEGMEQEAIRLHSLLGEKLGEPAKRYLNINSSAAGQEISIPVHKDCIVIFTYNPGQEDVKLKQATHDRCVNLDFDYPTKEAECRRLAKMVNRVLRDETNNVPEGLRKELEPDVMEPFVGVVEKMRNIARENAAFIEQPGARTAARLCLQMMFQAYQGDNRGDRTARLLLDYCRSYEEKTTTAPDSLVNQILSDELPALQTLNDAWYNEGARDRGEEPLDSK